MIDLSWRWLICLGAIPSLVFLMLSMFMLTESPSFLMVSGRHQEAQDVLLEMRSANNALHVDVTLPDQALTVGPVRRPSVTIREKLGIVFGRHLAYSTLVVCVSVFTLNFLFYGGLYAFPQVLPDLKLHVSPAVNLMVGAIVELPGYFVGVMVGNYLSRKTCMLMYLLIVLTSTLTFSLAGMSIMNTNLQSWLEMMVQ